LLIEKAQFASLSKPASGGSVSVSEPTPIRLLEIRLPQFDGTTENWESFYDTFSSTIDRNERLTSVQKLHYLRSSLTGIAAQSIQSLDTTEANYAIALTTLKEKFDCPRQSCMRHWHAITDYPKLTKETPAAIRAWIETVKQHLRALENSGESLVDIALFGALISKLSTDTINQWELTLPDSKMPSHSHLIAFLEKRANCGKMGPTSAPAVKTSDRKPIAQRYHTRQTASREHTFATTLSPPTCPICYRPHGIWRCEVFRMKFVSERIKAIKRASCCTNCLKKGHSARDCNAEACHKCGHRDNTLLHRATRRSKSRSSTSSLSSSSSNSRSSTPNSTPSSASTRYRTNATKHTSATDRTSSRARTSPSSPRSSHHSRRSSTSHRTPPSSPQRGRTVTPSPTSSPQRHRKY
jgi:hypothetical protein